MSQSDCLIFTAIINLADMNFAEALTLPGLLIEDSVRHFWQRYSPLLHIRPGCWNESRT